MLSDWAAGGAAGDIPDAIGAEGFDTRLLAARRAGGRQGVGVAGHVQRRHAARWLGHDGRGVVVGVARRAQQAIRHGRGARRKLQHLRRLRGAVLRLHSHVGSLGVGLARLGVDQSHARVDGRIRGRLVALHAGQDLVLVGQVGVADDLRVGDGDSRLAHLQRLLELAVLERHLHRLLGHHHVIGADGHVVEVAARCLVEPIDLQRVLHLLARERVGLGDAEDAVAVVVGLDQLQDAHGQEAARIGQVVQRHGQLLLGGKLL